MLFRLYGYNCEIKFIRETNLSKLTRLFTFKPYWHCVVLSFTSSVENKSCSWKRLVRKNYADLFFCLLGALDSPEHNQVLCFACTVCQSVFWHLFEPLHSSREDRTGFYKENMSVETQRVLMDSVVGSVIGWYFAFIHFRGKNSALFGLGFLGEVVGFLVLLFCWFYFFLKQRLLLCSLRA